MKRKDFLKTGLAAGMGALLPSGRKYRSLSPISGKAKNIIFFAYDGFSWEDFSSAQHYSLRNFGRQLHIEKLFRSGSAGSMQSYSLTSMVTDSSAATTTWATGRKIVNGSLSAYPDGEALTTILELAKAHGKATGVVSTTRVSHATPAGWIAKHVNRRAEEEIADQLVEFKADVIEDATDVLVSHSDAEMLQQAIAGEIVMPDAAAFPRQPIATLARILKGGTNEEPTHLNINYGTTQHTAGAVPAAVYGNGVEVKPFGLVDNTDFFYWMTDALGINFENPDMSAQRALEYY